MALANAYFGSTLTDAQSAATRAAQQDLEGDIARRNYYAQIMQAALQRQRLGQQDNQFNQELGLRGQEVQANSLLRALQVLNQQQQLQQNQSLAQQGLANEMDIARLRYNPEQWRAGGDRENAERLRQQGLMQQTETLLSDEIDQHNSAAEATASRYNSLLKSLTDEKDTMFTARSTAQQKAWRELLDAMKVGGDDRLIKPEPNVDPVTKELNYKFVPVLRKTRLSRPTASSTTNDANEILKSAQDAIASGADPAAVSDRLMAKYNLTLPGVAPSIRGGAGIGATAGMYPNPGMQQSMGPVAVPQPAVRAQTMPIPGSAPNFQPNSGPTMVDLIRALQSYAGQ